MIVTRCIRTALDTRLAPLTSSSSLTSNSTSVSITSGKRASVDAKQIVELVHATPVARWSSRVLVIAWRHLTAWSTATGCSFAVLVDTNDLICLVLVVSVRLLLPIHIVCHQVRVWGASSLRLIVELGVLLLLAMTSPRNSHWWSLNIHHVNLAKSICLLVARCIVVSLVCLVIELLLHVRINQVKVADVVYLYLRSHSCPIRKNDSSRRSWCTCINRL